MEQRICTNIFKLFNTNIFSQLYPEEIPVGAENKMQFNHNGSITFPNRGNLTKHFRVSSLS